jgi:hypothetical protein
MAIILKNKIVCETNILNSEVLHNDEFLQNYATSSMLWMIESNFLQIAWINLDIGEHWGSALYFQKLCKV